ncbi:hypothetical protein DNFV4_01175 [Nitrospira tepida]|uniref:Uncharacterized protein n=1 Tax=Nitrospira tepida TaxID=2973512 RepID=A0AA86MXJ2_9BACT|nr:hypothetical protein DNFV4_01175 [Nitrospira tepida]
MTAVFTLQTLLFTTLLTVRVKVEESKGKA